MSYPTGDYLLDKQDDIGAINIEPLEAWQYLWDTQTIRNQRNNAIIKAQAMIRTEYNPERPINTSFKTYQDGVFLLGKLKAPPNNEDLMQKYIHSLSQHVDYQRGTRE